MSLKNGSAVVVKLFLHRRKKERTKVCSFSLFIEPHPPGMLFASFIRGFESRSLRTPASHPLRQKYPTGWSDIFLLPLNNKSVYDKKEEKEGDCIEHLPHYSNANH